jgi:hypothetical protein
MVGNNFRPSARLMEDGGSNAVYGERVVFKNKRLDINYHE